ncbi:MAG: OadG family protein [Alphaproteobacteria bacterium]
MENLSEALLLMVMGVGVVFLFLTVLVFAVSIMSKIVTKYFPEQEKPKATSLKQQEAVIAAAVAAVHTHRQKYNLKV